MKIRFKLAFSFVVVLLSLGVLSRLLHWMNQPSDFWLYAGSIGLVALVVAVPGVIALIWRDREQNSNFANKT